LKIREIFCENPRIIFVLFYEVHKENMFTINLEDGREAPSKASILYLYINRSSKYREYIATQSEIALEIATQLGALEPAEGEEDIEDEVERSTVPVQTSDVTNIRLTNVGQYKRQTSTNVGLVQTSDWHKCQTSTNFGRVHL